MTGAPSGRPACPRQGEAGRRPPLDDLDIICRQHHTAFTGLGPGTLGTGKMDEKWH